ncbi:hypothetical protein H4219_002361 [Mycoemilia scoparia]|uniref:Rho-GAP domain-containing protein n=1 Tax=Mycoemilia scoparia TaxID=417184 RepID=A0A9W8A740_9FUNG|nr:hypothetical protein H4219_002361 [Mycoemilia scoparia]
MGYRRSMSTSNALDPSTWVHVNDAPSIPETFHTAPRIGSNYLQPESVSSTQSSSTTAFSNGKTQKQRRQSLSRVRRFFLRGKQSTTFDGKYGDSAAMASSKELSTSSISGGDCCKDYTESAFSMDGSSASPPTKGSDRFPTPTIESPDKFVQKKSPSLGTGTHGKVLRRAQPSMSSLVSRGTDHPPKPIKGQDQRKSEERTSTNLLARLKGKVRRSNTQVGAQEALCYPPPKSATSSRFSAKPLRTMSSSGYLLSSRDSRTDLSKPRPTTSNTFGSFSSGSDRGHKTLSVEKVFSKTARCQSVDAGAMERPRFNSNASVFPPSPLRKEKPSPAKSYLKNCQTVEAPSPRLYIQTTNLSHHTILEDGPHTPSPIPFPTPSSAFSERFPAQAGTPTSVSTKHSQGDASSSLSNDKQNLQKSRSIPALHSKNMFKQGVTPSTNDTCGDESVPPLPYAIPLKKHSNESGRRQSLGWRLKTRSVLGKVGLMSSGGSIANADKPPAGLNGLSSKCGVQVQSNGSGTMSIDSDSVDHVSIASSASSSCQSESQLSKSDSLTTNSSKHKPPPIHVSAGRSNSLQTNQIYTPSPLGDFRDTDAATSYDSQAKLFRRTLKAMWDITSLKSPKSPLDSSAISRPFSVVHTNSSPFSAGPTLSDMSGVPPPSTPISTTNPNMGPSVEGSIFGMKLSMAAKRYPFSSSIPLPPVVVRCIEYINKHGLDEQGIYRIPGAASVVNRIKKLFILGEDVDLDDVETDVYSVATLLKMYLRELPEPLLTTELKEKFDKLEVQFPSPSTPDSTHSFAPSQKQQSQRLQEILGVPKLAMPVETKKVTPDSPLTREEWSTQLKELVDKLPESNFNMLSLLMNHLCKVNKSSQQNMMHLNNLRIIFCPTLNIRPHIFLEMASHPEEFFPAMKKLEMNESATGMTENCSGSTLAPEFKEGKIQSPVVQSAKPAVGEPTKLASETFPSGKLSPSAKKQRSYSYFAMRSLIALERNETNTKTINDPTDYDAWLKEIRPEWLDQVNVSNTTPNKRRSARRSQPIPSLLSTHRSFAPSPQPSSLS